MIGLRRCSALGRSRWSMGPEQIGAGGNVRPAVSGGLWGVLPCCRRPKAPQSVRACAPLGAAAPHQGHAVPGLPAALPPDQHCGKGQAAVFTGGC